MHVKLDVDTSRRKRKTLCYVITVNPMDLEKPDSFNVWVSLPAKLRIMLYEISLMTPIVL